MLNESHLPEEAEAFHLLVARVVGSNDGLPTEPKLCLLLEPGCRLLVQFRQEPKRRP